MPLYAAYGAAGLMVQSEEIGPRQLTYYALSYNYVMSTAFGIFSVGVRPGLYQWKWDGSKIVTPSGNYDEDFIDHMDPELLNAQLSGTVFNLDGGIHFQNATIKAGVFFSQLFPGRMELINETGYGLNLEWGAYGQYTFEYTNRIDFLPSAIIMADGNRYQSAVKFGTLIDKIYYASMGLRGYSGKTLDAVMIAGGLKMSDNFWVYYNFDIGLSKLRSAHSGSHEIIITYRLDQQIGGVRPPKIIYNPRYIE
jgi:type IX secretion system PorP/SprF family membrane protein